MQTVRTVALSALAIAASPSCRARESTDLPTAPSLHEVERDFDAHRPVAGVLDALALRPGAKVADVGAGSGLWTVHLAERVAPSGSVIATDTTKAAMIDFDRRLRARALEDLVELRIVRPREPGLDLGVSDAFTFGDEADDESGTYDAILIADVDHVIADEARWLKRALPALKPNGRIVITNRVALHDRSLAEAQKAGLALVSDVHDDRSFVAAFVPR